MQSFNVLVIAYYFPPMGLSGVQRTLKFVKYLQDFGWNPIVLTCDPKQYYAFDESLNDDLRNAIVYRTKADGTGAKNKTKEIKYPSKLRQKVQRIISQTFLQPDSRIFWKKQALETAEEILKNHKIDAIYSTAPPFTDFLVAKEISEKHKIPFMIDYRDLWVDNAYYFYATPFHRRYSAKLENEILTKARRVVVISRSMKESLLRRYKILKHGDVTVIPHGYDAEDMNQNASEFKTRNKFVLAHSGMFQDDLTPKYFLKALAQAIKKNPELQGKIECRFVGLMKKSHLNLIKRYKLENYVSTLGYLPHKEAIAHCLASDLLWIMIPNDIVTPSRLYEYIGTRKPILISAPDGSMKQMVMQSGAGFATAVSNINEIETKILELFELWKSNKLPQIPLDYSEKFERKYLTEQLSKELSHTLYV